MQGLELAIKAFQGRELTYKLCTAALVSTDALRYSCCSCHPDTACSSGAFCNAVSLFSVTYLSLCDMVALRHGADYNTHTKQEDLGSTAC